MISEKLWTAQSDEYHGQGAGYCYDCGHLSLKHFADGGCFAGSCGCETDGADEDGYNDREPATEETTA